MTENLRRFPIRHAQRMQNLIGRFGVPCKVTDRWLKFPEISSGPFEDGEYLPIEVMTMGNNDKPKKICELVVTREDLLRVLTDIKRKE